MLSTGTGFPVKGSKPRSRWGILPGHGWLAGICGSQTHWPLWLTYLRCDVQDWEPEQQDLEHEAEGVGQLGSVHRGWG